ncbi:MAG: DnaJ domain-containing protein, partial [Halococcoides sp.]
MPTLYEVLDVERDADRARIQAAFRDRVKAVHPDHSDDPDAREKFQRVYTAQEVLCDPAERQRYDTIGHASYVRQHGDPDLWNLSSGTDRTVEGTATRSTGSATRSGADREAASG